VNIDWSASLRIAQSRMLRQAIRPFVGEERRRKLDGISGPIIVHNLRKGIPFATGSVDAVYLSHLLEHIDRKDAPIFLSDILRVLRPGGIARIVVPDLLITCRDYLESYEQATSDSCSPAAHEETVGALLEQSVRRTSRAIPQGAPSAVRRLATFVLGDARRRGETHQWMYDDVSLRGLLTSVGFSRILRTTWDRSGICDWNRIALDRAGDGEYRPRSLYIEAMK
jgi:SAM-dependent methyltransferase